MPSSQQQQQQQQQIVPPPATKKPSASSDSKLDLKISENEYWDVEDPVRRKKFQFKIEEVLGRGSFGQVVKAVDYNSGRQVAIKGTTDELWYRIWW